MAWYTPRSTIQSARSYRLAPCFKTSLPSNWQNISVQMMKDRPIDMHSNEGMGTSDEIAVAHRLSLCMHTYLGQDD